MKAFSDIFTLRPSFQFFVLFLGLATCAPTPVPPAQTETELITRFDAEVTRLIARHRKVPPSG